VYIYIYIANRNAMNYIQLLRLHLLCFMQMPLLLAVVEFLCGEMISSRWMAFIALAVCVHDLKYKTQARLRESRFLILQMICLDLLVYMSTCLPAWLAVSQSISLFVCRSVRRSVCLL